MKAASPHFRPDLTPGATVRMGSELYRIEALTDVRTVLAKNLADGTFRTLDAAGLAPAGTVDAAASRAPDMIANAAKYEVAQRRLAAIQPLLDNPLRTRTDVSRVAAAEGVNASTIYNWMRAYEDSPQVSSLIPATRGPDKGGKRLAAQLEAIVTAAIDKHLRTPQRGRAAKVMEAVGEACTTAKLPAPHGNTIRNRVRALPKAATLRSQGRGDEARDTYDPIRGAFPGADAPLSMIQMDHGLANVEIVDERLRLALGRPWVTVAFDVYSRMVVGIVVSLERPSAFAAGRCLANAMLTKDAYLKRLGIPGDWPAWGKFLIVHMDNAKEFRGALLRTAFAQYNMQLRLRKVKTPHYGGHIERYMRTLSDAMRDLPGATFANPEERKGYNSSERAAMTLAEFEAWLVDHIVNKYHQMPHDGLGGTPPAARWREGILGVDGAPGIGIPSTPTDPERLMLDFLPFEERTMGRKGILFDHIHYWNDAFRHRIAEADPKHPGAKRKFLFRHDPRDVTRIWFHDPDTGEYVLTPTWDLTRPAVSRWEWNAVKAQTIAEGAAKVDENRLFDAIGRLRERAETSLAKTKAARRLQQRAADAGRHAAEGTDRSIPRVARWAAAPTPAAATEPNRFSRPVARHDDIDA